MSEPKNINFISNAVFKIEFDDIDLSHLETFSSSIAEDNFKQIGTKESIEGSVKFSSKDGPTETTEVRSQLWIFKNKENSSLIVGKNIYSLEYKKPFTFQQLIDDIEKTCSSFIKILNVKTIRRVGLRLVNNISLIEKNKIDWSEYINSDLIASIDFIQKNDLNLARSMTQQMVKFDDSDLTMSYGIWNPDFPSEVVKKEFVLDYDCASKYPQDALDFKADQVAMDFYEHIKKIYKNSITQKLKDTLVK